MISDPCVGSLKSVVHDGRSLVPRKIDPQQTFENLIRWIQTELIEKKAAPGFVVGVSGTDSIVVYLAFAEAFRRLGLPDRVVGVHFAPPLPSNIQELDPVERDAYWFQIDVIPWLRSQAPDAQLFVDSSINHRKDGLRWGALVEFSVPENLWVVGTRNATENALNTFSNMSGAVSVQPILHLWKSEILQLAKYLGAPNTVIERSRQADCDCGRDLLPAAYIDEVDAMLMVRQGQLDPAYVEATIPSALRAELQDYIDVQIAKGMFKRQIPYVVDAQVGVKALAFGPVESALVARKAPLLQTRQITEAVPKMIANSDSDGAALLVGSKSDQIGSFLPEALSLFRTSGLRASQVKRMIENLFGLSDIGVLEARRLALINASLGNYSFSFPQWRFLTQRMKDGRTLAESFGMLRLIRANDVRDPHLPYSNPDRDEWGTGFRWSGGDWHIEYRRAYVLISKMNAPQATLVIRNSSYFFGRDRLPEAVYYSTHAFSQGELDGLMLERFKDEGLFVPWQQAFRSNSVSLSKTLKAVGELLNRLDQLNQEMSDWLVDPQPSGGFSVFVDFVRERVETAGPDGKVPFYLGYVRGNLPSWAPANVRPVDQKLVEQLKKTANPRSVLEHEAGSQNRLILMSGQTGDFP